MTEFLKMHKWCRRLLKILLGIIIGVIIILIGALIFIKIWPAFGDTASKEDKKNYESRAENYIDGKFQNEGTFSEMQRGYEDPYSDRTSEKGTTPEDTLPTVASKFLENPSETDFTVTWYGHSILVMQISGMNIAIDPVFSDITSPVSFVGNRRFSPLNMEIEDLPEIDICILSHDHYDHLDYQSIKKISSKVNQFIVPLGVENHLERWGIDSSKIKNMAWWEETEINGLTIACTPARHYSRRALIDNYESLWASWVFINDNIKVFESGDTGYYTHFEDIVEKYGTFDFTMLDCAQYNEIWHYVHMFPEEAVEAAKTLGADVIMPIHWGAFSLAGHSWDDPPERVTQYGEEKGLTVVTPRIGETMNWNNYLNYQERWWRDYQ